MQPTPRYPKVHARPRLFERLHGSRVGGFSNVSQGTYKGRRVAIKVAHMYTTSNRDVVLSVSFLLARLHSSELMGRRGFAERQSPGNTSGIQISCHFSE